MFESLIGLVVIIAMFVIVSRQQGRISLIERELGALRSLVLSGAHAVLPEAKPAEQAVAAGEPVDAAPAVAAVVDMAAPSVSEAVTAQAPVPEAAPATAEPAKPAAAVKAPQKPDIETALGTRWAACS